MKNFICNKFFSKNFIRQYLVIKKVGIFLGVIPYQESSPNVHNWLIYQTKAPSTDIIGK